MSDPGSEAEQRDRLLLRLLKTPPQPRPKRERGEDKPTQKPTKRASGRQQKSRATQ